MPNTDQAKTFEMRWHFESGSRSWSMSVEFWKTICDWAAVVLVGLTFIAGAGALLAGRVLNSRQSEQLRKFEADLASAKTDNLTLQKQVAILQTDASIQQERAAKAEKSLLELQEQLKPRRLTAGQKSDLTKLLGQYKGNGAAIVTPLLDGEAVDFADDFKSALESAGWSTVRIANRISDKYGLAVVTCEGTKNPALLLAKKLSDALTTAGIPHDSEVFKDADASTSPEFHAGYVYLVVEHKPLPAPNQEVGYKPNQDITGRPTRMLLKTPRS